VRIAKGDWRVKDNHATFIGPADGVFLVNVVALAMIGKGYIPKRLYDGYRKMFGIHGVSYIQFAAKYLNVPEGFVDTLDRYQRITQCSSMDIVRALTDRSFERRCDTAFVSK